VPRNRDGVAALDYAMHMASDFKICARSTVTSLQNPPDPKMEKPAAQKPRRGI